jgi:hypothetical protein
VVAALSGRDAEAFGAPASREDLVEALGSCGFRVLPAEDGGLLVDAPPDDVRLAALAFAFGWRADGSPGSGARLARLS